MRVGAVGAPRETLRGETAALRILKIWDAEYPWDVRAEKVMRTLTGAGHEVHLVARNRRGDAVREELPEATVHRLRPWRWAGARLDALSQFPAFANPRWVSHVFRTAGAKGVDVIIVRDLPLTPTAVAVGRLLGVPVILDMAENYPAMMRDLWLDGRQGRFDVVVRNPRIVAGLERWCVQAVDHVIVVVEESGQRLVDLGVDPGRISLVCNTPWPSRIPERATAHEAAPDTPVRLVYLGLLEKPRGLEAVLGGLERLAAGGANVRLDVIGGGRDDGVLRAEAARLGLDERVTFHGVLPYEEALAIIAASHVGLVPHFAIESWNTTIPNKLFDYMSHAIPVATSDAKPAARVVREEDCGVVFRYDDAGDFARAIEPLVDPVERTRLGANGRRAVIERYNWDVDSERLLAAIARVA